MIDVNYYYANFTIKLFFDINLVGDDVSDFYSGLKLLIVDTY